jgi:hypothetical protein
LSEAEPNTTLRRKFPLIELDTRQLGQGLRSGWWSLAGSEHNQIEHPLGRRTVVVLVNVHHEIGARMTLYECPTPATEKS